MDEATFLTKVNQTEDCWLWIKATSAAGYGVFTRQSKLIYAHHQAWKLWKTPDLPVVIRHTCRNRHCVNPDHLEGGTHTENNGPDRVRDGTSNRGERHGHHTLTEEQVVEMRRLRREGLSLEDLMKRYGGVCHTTLLYALDGTHWSHVPGALTPEETKTLRHHKAGKLTDEQKDEIRRRVADGVTKARLAKEFGVSATTIANVLA
jgi:lambda repressor-like predicted transcriptional regulator